MTKQKFYVVAGSFAIRDFGFARSQAVRMAIESHTHVRVEDSNGNLVAAYDCKGNRTCLRCGATKLEYQEFPGKLCPACDIA